MNRLSPLLLILWIIQTSWSQSTLPVDHYYSHSDLIYEYESGRLLLAVADHKTLIFAEGVQLAYIPEEDKYFGLETAPQMIDGRLELAETTLLQLKQDLAKQELNLLINETPLNPPLKLLDFKRDVNPKRTQYELKFDAKISANPVYANNWYHLDFDHILEGAEPHVIRYKKGQVRRFKVKHQDKHSSILFETNHLVGNSTTEFNQDSTQLTISFWRPGQSPAEKLEAQQAELRKTNPTKIHNIIIDAGHGGKDVGALGLKTNEKTITLKVSKKLHKLLKAAGYNPYLTRDDDRFLTLAQRPALAKKWNGDLFMSLHCNSIAGDKKKRAKVKGYKIYILRETSDKKDKELAKRENKFVEENSTTQKSISIVEWIKLEHQLNLYTKKSEDFASHIVRAFEKNKKNIRKHGTGAGQAGFYVLVGTFMPAVLVEMGFISNPDDERYMMSDKGSTTIAQRLTDAVISYDQSIK